MLIRSLSDIVPCRRRCQVGHWLDTAGEGRREGGKEGGREGGRGRREGGGGGGGKEGRREEREGEREGGRRVLAERSYGEFLIDSVRSNLGDLASLLYSRENDIIIEMFLYRAVVRRALNLG